MEQLIGKFYNFSIQKYSSNVVEKCLEKADENIITKFVDEISQHKKVIDLMRIHMVITLFKRQSKFLPGTTKINS